MKSRAIWIYVLVAVGLAGIYFFEVWQRKARVAEKIYSTTMFRIRPSEISAFSISKGGVKITAVKTNDDGLNKWMIKSPISTEADGLRVQQFLEKLSRLRWQRKISEGTDNLSLFGLDNPKVVISFQGNGGSGSLFIGSPTPLGDDVYVQRNGDQSIYTISFADKFDLDVDLFDLRDKRLITLSPSEVTRVDIKWKGKKGWALEKAGDRWEFTNDERFGADSERVQTLLSRLWTMRATSIIEERCGDLSKYGLGSPRVVIRLWKGREGESQELWIGRKAEEGQGLYAKVRRNERVVTVRNWILSDIPPTPQGFKK